jgi:membrane protease YdiL (CAAX protease family)
MAPGAAAFMTAALFACVHLPDLGFLWYALPNLLLLGLVLAWLRLKSGSLWPAVLAHAVNNALAVVSWFVVTP